MNPLKEIHAGEFESARKSKYFLLDFYSDECPNCEKLKPILEELNENFEDSISFAKIFRQKNRPLAESMNVLSSPTVLFFEEGELKFRMSGNISKSDLRENILKYVPENLPKLKENSPAKDDVYDVIIIGGGPAGLSAAIYGARYKLKQMVIAREVGGLAATAHKICNFPSYENISGIDLMQKMREQAEALGVFINYGTVGSITNSGDQFNVNTDDGSNFTAKKLIYAAGTEHNKLNVKGEREFLGLGVSYCATCDGQFYKNKTVAVVGGGNSALTAALLLAEFAKKVYIIYRQEKFFKAEPAWIESVNSNSRIETVFREEVAEICGEQTVNGILLKSGRVMALDGVFIEIGSTPKTEMLQNLGLSFDKGYLASNAKQETEIKGFYAAGDVTNSELKQIVTATAQGAVAAYNAYVSLMQERD